MSLVSHRLRRCLCLLCGWTSRAVLFLSDTEERAILALKEFRRDCELFIQASLNEAMRAKLSDFAKRSPFNLVCYELLAELCVWVEGLEGGANLRRPLDMAHLGIPIGGGWLQPPKKLPPVQEPPRPGGDGVRGIDRAGRLVEGARLLGTRS